MALQDIREALVGSGQVIDSDPDFLLDVIRSNMPANSKRVRNGVNICCPLCVTRGEARSDTKFRCGVRFLANGVAINCFNCKFSARWNTYGVLSRNIREFLTGIGLGQLEVNKLNFTASFFARNNQTDNQIRLISFQPDFKEVDLPKDAQPIMELLQQENIPSDLNDVALYLFERGESLLETTNFYWSPSRIHGMNRRVIIPFYWQDKLVGYSGRAIEEVKGAPKYWTETPAHFLFNNNMMYKDRKFIILVEGLFDALSIDGVATQGAKLSNEQAMWINQCGKEIVVCPDRDETGQKMIDLALQQKWKVSFPEWPHEIKDANDAVKKYGKLYTVKMILEKATDNRIQINSLRKRY